MHKISILNLMLLLAGQAHGMKIDTKEFIRACDLGDVEKVQAMLDAGVDVNAQGYFGETALSQAAYSGHASVVSQLIRAGAKLDPVTNDSCWTPLMWALAGRKSCDRIDALPVVIELITAGVNVQAVGDSGETALMFAEIFGPDDVAEEIRKEIKWQGPDGIKAAWFAAVVQQQRAASASAARVEIVE